MKPGVYFLVTAVAVQPLQLLPSNYVYVGRNVARYWSLRLLALDHCAWGWRQSCVLSCLDWPGWCVRTLTVSSTTGRCHHIKRTSHVKVVDHLLSSDTHPVTVFRKYHFTTSLDSYTQLALVFSSPHDGMLFRDSIRKSGSVPMTLT